MRTILFKGKRNDNGEWIYGLPIHEIESLPDMNILNLWYIDDLLNGSFEVDPSTVCQYTGLNDKNGNMIFEGDIVKVRIERADFTTVVTWGKNSRGWKLKCDRTKIERFGTVKYYSLPSSDRIEMIGNIHDKK